MSDKVYVGCANEKTVELKDGGSFDVMKVSISEEGLDKMKDALDNGWVNLDVTKKRNVVEGKPTHSVAINTWKPKAKEDDGDNLPF